MLCTRRGQSQAATIAMLDLVANTLLDKLPDRESKYKMYETLRTASDGKMFLEREYANCTTKLVQMLEEDGKRDEGANIIQEI